MLVKLLLLIIFFGIMLAVGFYCRRSSRDIDGFVLGGRAVGPWLSAFAYGTSYFSAVIFVGYAGQFGWKFGLASTWIGIGNALIGSLLAWSVLGRRTRIMSRHLDTATLPEFFERRFKSKKLSLSAAAIIFVFLIPYTASLYNGLSRLFETAFDIDYSLCIILMSLLTGIYVIAGGYMATAINDFIQGLIMLVGIVAIIYSVLKLNGGAAASVNALAYVCDSEVSSQPGVFASFFGPEPLNLLAVVILTSLGTWGLPQMVQKFYAIESEKAVLKGTVISTLFAFVIAGGCYFLGGFSRLFPVDIAAQGFDAIIPNMISKLSPFLVGITVILVLSASMSTLSSLVLTSASTITLDFINPLRDRERRRALGFNADIGSKIGNEEKLYVNRDGTAKLCDEKATLMTIRLFVAVFILISAVIAVLQYKLNLAFIAQLMGLSWGALAGSFLAPFLFSLYWKRTSKYACFASFVWGSGLMLLNMFANGIFPELLKNPVNCGAFCMLGSLLIVPLVSLITEGPGEEYTAKVFSCYDKMVSVPVTEALPKNDD